MVPYGGGKNQESSTEAINAWYGMYLFGLAMNNPDIMNTGKIMLAQEIRATQKYYHINLPQTNPIYLPVYTNKFQSVTNLYQGTMDASTFFGDVNYYATGIQIIPVTPVTEQLWGKNYSTQIFNYSPNGLKFTPCFDPGNVNTIAWQWTSIAVGVQAIAYPQDALDFFKHYRDDLGKLDNGQSHSNVYYWIITRNNQTTAEPPKLAVITLAPQGFYNISTGKLNMRDTVKVYLRNISSPYGIVDSAKSVIDSVNFTGSFLFANATNGIYYLQVKHRNSLETWSKPGGEIYNSSNALIYDFTSSVSQAYGNNLILKSSEYCIYSGDVDRDGAVDLTDLTIIENSAVHFASGYVIADINGDRIVDVLDATIADNNALNFVGKVDPFIAP
jgi:hypothetical protein